MQQYSHPAPGRQGRWAATALPPPQVEVLTQGGGSGDAGARPWYRAKRLRVFALVFLLVLVPGLVWDFLRPAQYVATASVLTVVAPPGADAGVPVAMDVQHVAIQRQVLLGRDLLTETLRLVGERTEPSIESPDALVPMLSVEATPDTNLVALHARGEDPALLSVVVNAWIDGYLNLRQRVLEEEIGARRRALEDELAGLTEQLDSRRTALDDFRAEHDIVTLERDGNEALARLSALTDDLNRARDESVEAEARYAAVRDAIDRGDPVVPPSEEASLEELENRASELRARLIELKKRFTPLYLENEPDLMVIPAQLEALEKEILERREKGGKATLALADQELQQTRRRVEVLEADLVTQKESANEFTTAFARYQTMQEELTKLAEMQRDLQTRLVELDAKGLEKYPAVEVVEAAHPPARPVEPDYWRDAGLVLLAAFAAGLCAVLLLEFLTRRPEEDGQPTPITGIRVFAGAPSPVPALGSEGGSVSAVVQEGTGMIAGAGAPSLPAAGPEGRSRELIAAEVGALWALADPMSRELMALMLSGLTLEECASLVTESFDLEDGSVQTAGDGARQVKLSAPVVELFAACSPLPMWMSGGSHLNGDELSTRIALLAHDAGIAQPDEVTAEALRYTYIAYLVRQGARLSELERIIGPTAPSRLAAFRGLAPAGAAKSLDELDLVYPVLRTETGA
jgi:uncharacterized protein involved in exopolysaccharide biosynthesis